MVTARGTLGHRCSRRGSWVAAALLVLAASNPGLAQNAGDNGDEFSADVLWNNFNHYVLVARPDLAEAFATRLLEVDGGELLAAVEQGRFDERPLLRAKRTEGLEAIAERLERAIQQARINRARDPERIARNIDLLAQGARAYRNSVERLRAAGPYAAPQLLDVLRDPDQTELHPYVTRAMIALGDSLVYPLSASLNQLEPVALQQVAQVLSAIGYPQAIPYLQDVVEDTAVDVNAREVAQVAMKNLCTQNQVDDSLAAADYYYLVGLGEYNAQTRGDEILGYDALEDKGLVWAFQPRTGLVRIPVPTEVFGDVLAMRSAARALELAPGFAAALSLHLRANLRRENNLPADEQDPSYPSQMRPASFYLLLAGPVRQQEVLAVALNDGDADLALDAINALQSTSGTAALTQAGPALIRALNYPDRRVRFRAAETLANARPTEPFDRSFRVVPVLAEAVRQGDVRHALVLAANQDEVNKYVAELDAMGYEAFGGQSITEASEFLSLVPGVDLVLIAKPADEVMGDVTDLARDYKTVDSPIVAVVTLADQLELRPFADERARLTVVPLTVESEAFADIVEQAAQSVLGDPIRGNEAEEIALDALNALQKIAVASKVYPIADAELALIRAVQDERDAVAREAARTLALIDSAEAQQAIALAAFEASGDLRLSHLNALAESAIQFGNGLSEDQVSRLMELMASGDDELAVTAARAHGALTLPTSLAVEALTEGLGN